jgi:hypothetical protein
LQSRPPMTSTLRPPTRAAALLPLIALASAVGCGGGGGARALADAPLADPADAAPDAAAPDAGCDPVAPDSHVQLELDTVNAEWVKSVRWLDSTGTLTANLAHFGGGPSCSGPTEQWGQLYGAPEGNPPSLVGGNTLATLTRCGADLRITSAAMTCDTPPIAQVPVTTTYHLYGGAQASQLRVTRTIGFSAATPKYPGVGVRPYVPRPPIAQFTSVIYPNAAGTAVTTTATCGGDCFLAPGTTWSGRWFADIAPTSGLAMIVLRDPAMTAPAQLTVNNDNSSASNLSSFVLVQPAAGWQAPITEVEYLCFADLTSWPQAQRDAATLPAGCGP